MRSYQLDSFNALLKRAENLISHSQGRVLLGISGEPGAGKSTLAKALTQTLASRGYCVSWVPMDGFHLADATLEALGRLGRKGAIDTFDGWGYLTLLRRVKAEITHSVFAPDFERELEQPLAAAINIAVGTQIIITEGNYLLAPSQPWDQVRSCLDEIWHCVLDDEERQRRLVARHINFGKSPKAAKAWVEQVDQPNSREIATWIGNASLIVDMTKIALPQD